MSSLSLSILILCVLVAVIIAGQSAWVLLKDRKKKNAMPETEKEPELETSPDASRLVKDPNLPLVPASAEPTYEALPEAPIEFSKEQDSSIWKNLQSTSKVSERDLFDETAKQVDLAKAASTVFPKEQNLAPSHSAESVQELGPRVLHDDADCLVELKLVQVHSGDRLIGLTKSIRRAGGKPVGFEGLTQADHWEGLRYGINYKSLRAGILLANRQGPLNAMEFSEFASKLQTLAAQLATPLDLPEMNALMQRARGLDALLADSDVQLGLAVECSQALAPADLANLAKRLNLYERGNTRYACLSDASEVIYSVALGDKAQRLQLMFDVPRVAPDHKPWWKMAEAAHQAAILFDGKIIDDNGRELSEQSFRTVAIALEGRQQALAEAGVPAGSALALRVFN